MKMSRLLVVALFCGMFVTSCLNPPDYPDAPEITFKDVSYKKGGPSADGGFDPDTVFLTLSFKDGDGDVGVSTDEFSPPFNDRWYLLKSPLRADKTVPDDCRSYDKQCWYVNTENFSEFDKYVDYSDRRKLPQYASLEAFEKPFDCLNWEIWYWDHDAKPDTPDVPLDTLYFQLNTHYNNIFIEFQVRTDNPGELYKPFDEKEFFNFPACGVRIFDGRIPILQDDPNGGTPLEGDIRYAIPSVSYQTIFGGKTLRLKAYIEDRALNQSNVVFTRDFTLTQ